MTTPKLAVLVSGSGTILAAMIEAGLPIKLVLVDKPCRGSEIAVEAGIDSHCINRSGFGYLPGCDENWDRKGFTEFMTGTLMGNNIDLVAMAGFMTILHPVIFEDFRHRILNIHPALLPAFKGEHAVRDALAAGVTETGTTIHIATEVLDDESFIVDQIRVPVLPGDDEATLHERIKVQERELYPRVLWDIFKGTIDLGEIVQQKGQ